MTRFGSAASVPLSRRLVTETLPCDPAQPASRIFQQSDGYLSMCRYNIEWRNLVLQCSMRLAAEISSCGSAKNRHCIDRCGSGRRWIVVAGQLQFQISSRPGPRVAQPSMTGNSSSSRRSSHEGSSTGAFGRWDSLR